MPDFLTETVNKVKDTKTGLNTALTGSQFDQPKEPINVPTFSPLDLSQTRSEIPTSTADTSVTVEELSAPTAPVTAPTTPAPNLAQATVDSAQVPAVSPVITPATPETPPAVVAPATPGTDALNARIEKALNLLPGTLGQGQALLDEEQKRGVEDLNNKLAAKRGEIATKTAEYNAQIQSLEGQGRGIPLSIIRGQQGALVRQAASEIGILQAEELSLTGQLTAAQDAAKRAVDLEYADREQELANQLTAINLLKPVADAEETKRLEARADAATKEQNRLAEEKETKNFILSTLTTALANGADTDIANAIKGAKTELEALNAAGQYVSDPLDRAIKGATLKEKNLSIKKLSDEIKAANTPLTIPTAPGSTNERIVSYLNTAGKKSDLSQGERENLTKAMTVIDQIDNLETIISEGNTGPFGGKTRSFISKLGGDVNAAEVNAALQAIVPNLARGVFGEVGVLTDADIENYRKTLPNLNSTEDQNDAVLALVLKTVQKSFENQLDAARNSNINVSGWVGSYQELTDKVNTVEDRIGVSKAKVDTVWQQNPDKQEMIMELFKAGADDRKVLELLGY